MKVTKRLLLLWLCSIIGLLPAIGQSSDSLQNLYVQAAKLYESEDFDQAQKVLRDALQKEQSNDGTPATKAQLMNNLSLVLFKDRKQQEALSLLSQAKSLAASVKDDRLMAAILTNSAIIKKRQKDYSGALSLAQQALDLDKVKEDQAQILDLIADIYTDQQNLKAARETRLRLILLCDKQKSDLCADNLLWLSDLEKSMRDTKRAEQHLMESVKCTQEHHSPTDPVLRGSLMHLAHFYEDIGKAIQAEKIWKQFVSDDLTDPNQTSGVGSRILLANFYVRQNRKTEVAKVYEEAVGAVFASKLSDAEKGDALRILADSADRAKQFGFANRIYPQAIALMQKQYDKHNNSREGKEAMNLGMTLRSYAESLEAAGDKKLAGKLRTKAHDISERRRHYAASTGVPDLPEMPEIKFHSMEEPSHKGIFLK
jgi:tetratricopeptide (TPR) repeat protein